VYNFHTHIPKFSNQNKELSDTASDWLFFPSMHTNSRYLKQVQKNIIQISHTASICVTSFSNSLLCRPSLIVISYGPKVDLCTVSVILWMYKPFKWIYTYNENFYSFHLLWRFSMHLKFFFIEKNLVKLQDVYKDLSITERSKVNKNKQDVKSVPQYI
jgi:hypothetical protein